MPWIKHQDQVFEVKSLGADQYQIDENTLQCEFQQIDSHQFLMRQGNQQSAVYLHQQGQQVQLWYQGEYYDLQKLSRKASQSDLAHSGSILAPLTGKVIQLVVEAGQSVGKGDVLVILESMKMETALTAPFDAQVQSVHCQAGDQISNGQLLVELTEAVAAEAGQA